VANWIRPAFSKSRVKAAGKRLRDGTFDLEDVAVLENWRACHSYILNTFQAILRFRSKGKDITVAQRLKRRHTIFDKLRREPSMQLSTMHDIAGCRLIFDSEAGLMEFRRSLHKSKARHKLRSSDSDRYNYILYPKESGYRSVHDVYEYCVSSKNGVTWNGLLIEIQYRTIFQHAWATAVEVADLITYKRIKFSEADQDHHYFFQLANEIIARAWESRISCLSELPNGEIVREFNRIDKKLGLMGLFENLKQSKKAFGLKMNTLLIFHLEPREQEDALQTETFDNVNKAIERYEELEKSNRGNLDIVLVRADSSEDVRVAFRNYFSDAHDFVQYINDGCRILEADPHARRVA
jgi:putative GTP pyrophosphokinase